MGERSGGAPCLKGHGSGLGDPEGSYGKGPRYWGPMDDQCTLNLIETKPGEDREILLHYEAVR